jgi:hypothetical protein
MDGGLVAVQLTLTVVQYQFVFHEMLKQLEGHNSTSTPISRLGNRIEVKFT